MEKKKYNFRLDLNKILFIASMIIYLGTRIVKIEDFPIYFFCDEAIQSVKAERLIKNGLRDDNGNFLSLFFPRFGSLYNLGITPYFHIPSVLFAGKHIWATRGTVALISLSGVIFISLLLKNIFRLKRFWAVVLFLAATPLHFLFTRSAFEGGITTSLYAIFLYFYFLYRNKNPKYIFPSIFFSAITFYTYSGIYIPMIVTCILFLVFDLPYHLKYLKLNILGLFLAILLFLPAFIFQIKNPDLIQNQLNVYGSYLTKPIPMSEKIPILIRNYLTVFSYKFLFIYDQSYHIRHYIKNYGYFGLWSLPFILLGFIYLISQIFHSNYRILLLALLAAPLGGVLLEPGSHRILVITVLFACMFGLGMKLLEIFEEKIFKKSRQIQFISLLLFLFFIYQAVKLTVYSLKEGGIWFDDYGLYGMQYGTKQLFSEINKSLDSFQLVIASPDYANATDVYIPFFIPKENQNRVKLRSIREFLTDRLPTENTVVYALPDEYTLLTTSDRFKSISVLKIIPAPNGQPAFYKLEIRYTDKIEQTEPIKQL